MHISQFRLRTKKLPDTLDTVDNAIELFMTSIQFDAKNQLSTDIGLAPENPFLSVVDIDTEEPGIIMSSTNTSDIFRRSAPVPQVQYKRHAFMPSPAPKVEIGARISSEEAQLKSSESSQNFLKQMQKKSMKDIKQDEKASEKIKANAEEGWSV